MRSRAARPRASPDACIALVLAIAPLLTMSAPAVAQTVSPAPSIFFRTSSLIGAFTPCVSGYQVVVPPGNAFVE
ncbi:MAG: hypothetical protein IPK00_09975 [Deltaproteobacteria bacterium]|nr:hypothetical protein [Deltaproteobacteria bacterium]